MQDNGEIGRRKLDLNFDEDGSNQNKEEVRRKIEEISEQAGFKSRSAAKKEEPARLDRRSRTRTGRTYPFNTKIKPETYDRIVQLSDQMSQDEDRYVSLAEVLEQAIEKFDEQFVAKRD